MVELRTDYGESGGSHEPPPSPTEEPIWTTDNARGDLLLQVLGPDGRPLPRTPIALRSVGLIPGVRLDVEVSDDFGYAAWNGLLPGLYRARLDPGRAYSRGASLPASHRDVEVHAGSCAQSQLLLADEPHLRLLVLREGQPASGIMVGLAEDPADLLWGLFDPSCEITTDPSGSATLVAPRPGSYTLYLRSGLGTGTTTLLITLHAGQQTSEVELPAGRLFGTVNAEDGSPLAGAEVRLVPLDLLGGRGCTTGSGSKDDPKSIRVSVGEVVVRSGLDGAYRVDELPGGEYSLNYQHPDHIDVVSHGLHLPEGGQLDLGPTTLPCLREVAGTVLGQEACSGVVQLLSSEGERVELVELDRKGRFRFHDVRLRRFHLSIDGYLSPLLAAPCGEFQVDPIDLR
ncbi:MAG: carboxypeptidase-like regulatory domain-containing protein [Planctomycetota bacterium]